MAYAEGVNDYLSQVGEKGLPAFFKLLGYQPEPWSPSRYALLLQVHGLGPVRHDGRSLVRRDG